MSNYTTQATASTRDQLVKGSPWHQNVVVRALLPFGVGGFSGICATVCVQPLDMIKVRLQLFDQGSSSTIKPSSLTVARSILRHDGILGLYQGLSAAVARQVLYGTSRLGLFMVFEDYLKERAHRSNQTFGFPQRAFASVCAGGLGAAIGTPTELALIRMQSDGLRPLEHRENYRSVIDTLGRITRHEGLRALWNGCSPTVVRATSTNFGQLTFFSESKSQLRDHTTLSARAQSLIAAAIGGFAAALFSAPFDLIKSRLQNQSSLSSGARKYRSMFDCGLRVAQQEGLSRFYRGFPAYLLRMGPHS